MDYPHNLFKRALREGQAQLGLWASLADPYATEVLATTDPDWILIDGEHAPNDLRSMLGQLQALAPYRSQPVVRTVDANPALIKQVLDIGAQTIMVPMIDTAEQAAAVVAATRYPPRGIRGVGAALGRASRWTSIGGYSAQASDEICILVQVESVRGLSNVREIAAIDGVDGVFFGPVDLSASMGLLDQPTHPHVIAAITEATKSVRGAGRAAGVLATDPEKARHYLEAGVQFVAIGVDCLLLANSAKAVLRDVASPRPGESASHPSGGSYG